MRRACYTTSDAVFWWGSPHNEGNHEIGHVVQSKSLRGAERATEKANVTMQLLHDRLHLLPNSPVYPFKCIAVSPFTLRVLTCYCIKARQLFRHRVTLCIAHEQEDRHMFSALRPQRGHSPVVTKLKIQ